MRAEPEKTTASHDTGGDRPPGSTGVLSSETAFAPPIGTLWQSESAPRGYYIDFSIKADNPAWPPTWLRGRSREIHVAAVQWGLGAFERFALGEGERWLQAASEAAAYLIAEQHHSGPQRGGWRQLVPMPHTYELEPPWLSSITQGEGASLLARLHAVTGEDRYADAAREALLPMSVPAASGGVLAELDGGPFLEEYPTDPPSFVLNGALFAIWGFRDVGELLTEPEATRSFERLSRSLGERLGRYDTGRWSRYDLYPHVMANLASPAYHLLHIRQLTVMEQLGAGDEYGRMATRFHDYRERRLNRARAVASKIAFRIGNPRSRRTALRAPWTGREAALRRAATQ